MRLCVGRMRAKGSSGNLRRPFGAICLLVSCALGLAALWPALVEEGPAEDGAPELRGGGASVSCSGAADASGAHRGALPRLPGGALRRVGVRWLCPDVAAFGVLKDEDAALFIEYDGYHGHY